MFALRGVRVRGSIGVCLGCAVKCRATIDHIDHECPNRPGKGGVVCPKCRKRIVQAMHNALPWELAEELEREYRAVYRDR